LYAVEDVCIWKQWVLYGDVGDFCQL